MSNKKISTLEEIKEDKKEEIKELLSQYEIILEVYTDEEKKEILEGVIQMFLLGEQIKERLG